MRRWIAVLVLAGLVTVPAWSQEATPTPIEQAVANLGHDDYDTREDATAFLRERGEAARDALETLLDTEADAEALARARILVEQLNRIRATADLVTSQRNRKLSLVTLDIEDAGIDVVLKQIHDQTGRTFQPATDDLERRCSIQCTDLPLLAVWKRLGIDTLTEVSEETKTPLTDLAGDEHDHAIPGARFRFSVTEWAPEGKCLGWIVVTDMEHDASIIEWDVDSVQSDAPFAIERCGVHSPEKVFIPNPEAVDFTVKLNIERFWYADVPFAFPNVRNGDHLQIHGYDLELRWPSIRVKAEENLRRDIFSSSLRTEDLKWELRPEVSRRIIGTSSCGVGVNGGAFGAGGKDVAWCGCLGDPKPVQTWPVNLTDTIDVRMPTEASFYEIQEILSISGTFHVPMMEEDTVTSQVLRATK
jgi:hypothetical protein